MYGEDIRNNKGVRLIDFCVINNLIITDTFYQHTRIHKRDVVSRDQKSITAS